MKTQKTNREWLNDLPEPIRGRAICNLKHHMDPSMDFKVVDLSKALRGSFVWAETPEGHGYWRAVHDGKPQNYLNI